MQKGNKNNENPQIKAFVEGDYSQYDKDSVYQYIADNPTVATDLLAANRFNEGMDEMRRNVEDQIIVNNYKDNNNEQQTKEYRKKMASSDTFKQRDEFYANFRSSLDNMGQTSTTENTGTLRISYQRYYKAAAGIAAGVALLVGGYMYINQGNDTENTLAQVTNVAADSAQSKIETTQETTNTDNSEKSNTTQNVTQHENTVAASTTQTDDLSIKQLIEQYVAQLKKQESTSLLAYATEQDFELPKNYTENDFLSKISRSTFRSDAPTIVAPTKFAIQTNPLTIKHDCKNAVEIVIKNNKKEAIWSKELDGTSQTTVCDSTLSPGTYYLLIKLKDGGSQQTIHQFFITD